MDFGVDCELVLAEAVALVSLFVASIHVLNGIVRN